MSLQARVKAEQISARVARQTVRSEFLGVILGEADRKGKTVSDEQMIAILAKVVKDNTATIGQITDVEVIAALQNEISIANEFLPRQMTEDEIRFQLQQYMKFSNVKDKGGLLKALKLDVPGQYDGRLAATVADSLLTPTIQ